MDTDLNIEVAAYIRTEDGFLTDMHAVAPYRDRQYHLPTFNPASNRQQRSKLRLINPTDRDLEAVVVGVDDQGISPGGRVSVNIPARGARTLLAQELEEGGDGFSGALGDGEGKWQLFVSSDGPLHAMSLLQSPTGHLTNLSSTAREEEVELTIGLLGQGEVRVPSDSSAIDCGRVPVKRCSGVFESGTSLVVEGVAAAGFDVVWQGCDDVVDNACHLFALDSDYVVTASFLPQEAPQMNDDVISLSQAQLEELLLYDVARGQLTFFGTETDAAGWEVGDVLISRGRPNSDDDRAKPFALRITDVDVDFRRRHDLYTAPAALEDVFVSGSFNYISVVDDPLTSFDVQETVGEGIQVEGQVSRVRASTLLNLRIRNASIEDFRLITVGQIEARLRTSIGARTNHRGSITVGDPIRMTPVDLGETGWTVVPEVTLTVTVDAEVGDAAVVHEATYDFVGRVIADYDSRTTEVVRADGTRGKGAPLRPYSGGSNNFEVDLPEFEDADVTVGVGASIAIDAVGPKAAFHTRLRSESKCSSDGVATYEEVDIALGGQLGVFSRDMAVVSTDQSVSRWLYTTGPGLREQSLPGSADDLATNLRLWSGVAGMRLTWGDEAAPEVCGATYNVYRDGQRIRTRQIARALNDTGLVAGREYCYAVSAVLPSGREIAPRESVCGRPVSGRPFRDCPECPLMIAVPAGQFEMGAPLSSVEADIVERVPHGVDIAAPFAVGVYEVRFDEWDACVADGGCEHVPRDPDGTRGRLPVVRVSWEHAGSYVEWLSGKTGESYRLLSEAEWEYVTRAGTQTSRYWGDSVDGQCAFENGADLAARREFRSWIVAPCDDGHLHKAPVGSFQPNPWGLHDTAGNVVEWIQDCWHPSYVGAPSDGSAWEAANCEQRGLRGASLIDPPRWLRSTWRNWHTPQDSSIVVIGFRVARQIAP